MKIADSKLKEHVERVAYSVSGLTDELKPICGLLDAYCWFSLSEGKESPRASEALEHLLSADLRPALRVWYRQFGDGMNPEALKLRQLLGELAGEVFG